MEHEINHTPRYLRARKRAGKTQLEAAVAAKVSPQLVRAFEKHGPAVIDDERIRHRLEQVFGSYEAQADQAA